MTDDHSAEAASVFAATAPLAFALPPAIRDRVLPLVMETMIQGGQVTVAGKLLAQRPNDSRLALARAMLAEANGDTEAAIHLFDAVSNDRDRLNRARAARRSVELRLASQQIDVKQAADALDKLLYVWRGDQRDLALRERLADLRSQSGSWRAALNLLRMAQADFPDQAAEIANRLQMTFSTLLNGDTADKLPALDLIALMDENADLLPATPEGDAMKLRLTRCWKS
jgi:tetratricopeptide (TPR) repeat protein